MSHVLTRDGIDRTRGEDETMGELMNVAELRVASPCPASWDAMAGDDRSRFCSTCEKHVYNIASLTSRQVMDLIHDTEGEFCGRLHRRRDGTVLTADCPVGLRSAPRRFLRRVSAGVLLGVGFVTTGTILLASSGPGWVEPPSGPGVTFAEWKDWALAMLGYGPVPPPAGGVTMGAMRCPRFEAAVSAAPTEYALPGVEPMPDVEAPQADTTTPP